MTLCNMRPNIFYAFAMVSRFMSNPNWSLHQAAIGILKYLKGTLRHGILFPSRVSDVVEVICY